MALPVLSPEKICIVQHDESVKEAAKRFSNEHKLGVKHEKYVEDELSKSIQYKQERRQVLRKILRRKFATEKKSMLFLVLLLSKQRSPSTILILLIGYH